ncbi:hypothetical protein [Consotaella salsifontis]|uniref:Uncharacterized protein n=1 Tax=Consotaella salsifontis TaxID=1365950 RepID=A0A1T4TG01_9HYPH|nr:hypothetical protein [Consotaella salsifontis]SKA39376.1 hypothetical protein SAMN05428963_1315 [Consotaella salsifontis]
MFDGNSSAGRQNWAVAFMRRRRSAYAIKVFPNQKIPTQLAFCEHVLSLSKINMAACATSFLRVENRTQWQGGTPAASSFQSCPD